MSRTAGRPIRGVVKGLVEIRLLIVVLVLATIGAASIWYVFLRPVPIQTTPGTIKAKTFRQASSIERKRAGGRRQDWGQDRSILLPDSDVFVILLDDPSIEVRFEVAAGGSDSLSVGQRMRVEYQRRSLPLIWSKVYVLEVTPLED